MIANKKKIGLFIVIFVLLIVVFSILLNFVLPVKTRVINGNFGNYTNGDVIFISKSDSYKVGDIIIYKISSTDESIFAEVIEKNTDGTYKIKRAGEEYINNPIENNINEGQIMGKGIASLSMYIFYPLLLIVNLFLAYILTVIIYKKLNSH